MKDEIKINTIGQLLDYVETEEKANELIYYITNLQEEVNKLTAESTEWESKYYDLKEENERLLKTQEMYEKKCNKIHQYITQNCEIIRHKDYDEIGKVNGGHILFLLNGGDENGNN